MKYIFPLIVDRWNDAKLYIGGAICNVLKDDLNSSNVVLCGYVNDLASFYNKADVAINPVYEGTGLKIKTFEAISYDKVTLVHPHSMIGIYNKSNAPLFASDNPKMWIRYLETIWDFSDTIISIKKRNMEYMESMNNFIINEYKLFMND